jgi:hypothetical protein
MSAMGLLIVTLMSGALAAVMAVIAWRVAREERQRGDARIAALAAEIHAEDHLPAAAPASVVPAPMFRPTIGIRAEPARRHDPRVRTETRRRGFSIEDLPLRDVAASTPVQAREPFGTPAMTSSGSRFGAVAAIGLFVFGSLAALAVWLSPGTPIAPREPVLTAGASLVTHSETPLELIALGHEREGDRLTVRGIVRNPLSGGEVDGLAAVVFVFDRNGQFLVSARTTLPAAALRPGAESNFQVTIPNMTDVGRYRVSFRSDERVVPHVDKRVAGTLARARVREDVTARQVQ